MAQQLSAELLSRALFSRALHYFARVATVGSVREASRQLNVSPSAVSRQIQQLQDRLDIPLFYNLGNTLRLSPAGEALLAYCEGVDASLDDTVNAISALSGNHTGNLRIGSVDSFANHDLARLLSGFSQDHPGVRLTVHVGSARDVAKGVRNGDTDVGFTFAVEDEEVLERVFVLRCPTRITVSHDHPLAARDNIAIEDCLAFEIGLLSPSTMIRQELELASTRAGAPWPRCIETNSFSLLQRLARSGRHVVFQPEYPSSAGTLRAGDLEFHALETRLPAYIEEFSMVTDRRIRKSAALSRFVDHALRFLSASSGSAQHRL